MKKFALIALALTAGVSCAFAATIKVPWFVDNALKGAGIPPTGNTDGFPKTLTLISLSNTTDTILDCSITYFSTLGTEIPFEAGVSNTFTLAPHATVQFRPVADDLVDAEANPQGQESPAGNAVPDRPKTVPGLNGSATIEFTRRGGATQPSDMGGLVQFFAQGSTRATAFANAHSLIPLFGSN
jgi:hypothetical protein